MNRITNEKFISLRLRCALGDTGVSQRELARLTGITEVTLSRYVNGNRIPKATTLKKIADALGVGLDYFFTEEELKNSNEELNNSTDLVSRQSAIDAHCELCEDKGLCGDICPDVEVFRLIPSAQPTLYGYDIKHLMLIAEVLKKENLPPERVSDALTDIGRVVAIVVEEFEETLRKAVEQCTIR